MKPWTSTTRQMLAAVGVTLLLCDIGAQEIHAQNVFVNLTDDGTLTIVEEFVGGKNIPFTTVEIVTENDVVCLIPHLGTSLNGQAGSIEFDPADIHRIDVANVNWLIVFAFPQPLIADLAVHGVEIVEIGSIAGFGGILGNTSIANGLGTGVVSISDVQIFGNLSVTTGHRVDLIQFGRPYALLDRWGPVAIHGDLSINTGQDDDRLWISDALYVGGDVEVQLGQGTDLLTGEDRLITEPDSNVLISLGQQ